MAEEGSGLYFVVQGQASRPNELVDNAKRLEKPIMEWSVDLPYRCWQFGADLFFLSLLCFSNTGVFLFGMVRRYLMGCKRVKPPENHPILIKKRTRLYCP